jgi:tetratricopeptide (TPR) repeat protein
MRTIPPDRSVDPELLALARRAASTVLTKGYAAIRDQLASRADRIEPSIQATIAAGELNEALEVVGALWFHWEDTGRVEEGRRLAALALDRAGDGGGDIDATQWARAMLTAAELAFRQGDQPEAERWNLRAIATASTAGDPATAAAAEVGMARVAFRRGQADAIESWSRKALDRAPNDLPAQRGAFHMLAWAAYARGDRQGAIDWFERSLGIRRLMGDPFGVAVELGNLGDMAAEAEDFVAAARYLGESLSISAELGNMYLLPGLIGSVGALGIRAGLAERGASLVAAARAIYQTIKLEPDPSTASMLEEAEALATAAILPDLLQSARTRGQGLSLDDAVLESGAIASFIQGDSTELPGVT